MAGHAVVTMSRVCAAFTAAGCRNVRSVIQSGNLLFDAPDAKEALEVIAIRGREACVVSRRKKNGFYGFPNNFIETRLGVAATSRNWSTIARIVSSPPSS